MTALVETRPHLSPDTYLLSAGEGRYLYAPLSRSYARINGDMEALLARCDGTRTVAELIASCGLPHEAEELFATLFAKGIVRPEAAEAERPQDGAAPGPARFTHLTLFPTHACNLACTYCYAHGGDRPATLAWGTAVAAFDFLFGQLPEGQEPVALTYHGGGEPTLAFPFIKDAAAEFRRRCRETGRRGQVSMVTNGTFGREVLAWILDEDIGVNFSFDGPPAVQDAQRPFRDGRGSYGLVVENIRRLREVGREVTVRATVTAASLAHMEDLVRECLDLGVGAVQAEPCFSTGRAVESGAAEPDPAEFAARFLEAYRLGLAHDVDVTYSGLRCTDTPRDRFCGACGDSVALTPEGYLTACFEVVRADDPAAAVFFVGRVDGESGRVSLDEARLAYLRRRVTPNLDGCSGCFLKHNCAGDCVVKALRSTGSIFGRVASRCRMAEIVNTSIISWIADGVIVPQSREAFDQYLY